MVNPLTYWVWLTIGLSPANRRKWALLKDKIVPEAVYDSINDGDKCGLTDSEFRKLKAVTLRQAEDFISDCQSRGINIYCPDDVAFPKRLMYIENPPSLLFTYGRLEDVRINPSVAIVGARDADEYAVRSADTLSYQLAEKGITVISGFARGIDSSAHNATLRAGGQTVAVLGCGLEYDYPINSRKFKERIAENGAVISEYFPFVKPLPENFKIRNRLVSGLSNGVLVIQAGQRSGTLNTAFHASSQNKDIFVLPPHDIFSGDYAGNIGLLRDGATPVYSANDIISNLDTTDL